MQMDDGHLAKLSEMDVGLMGDEDSFFGQNQDLIFSVGETVKVKGGDFRVKSFGGKMMVLEGIPGTRIKGGE